MKDDRKEYTIAAFRRHFGGDPEEVFFSPGRINIIGEHLDYNGGPVLPAAISLGIYAAVRYTAAPGISIYSGDYEEGVSLEGQGYYASSLPHWARYVSAMLDFTAKRWDMPSGGMEILLSGDLPRGAGLSSSASLLCLIGMLSNFSYYDRNRVELARNAQQVEREVLGVQCGIMDQFAICMGRKDMATLLWCDTLEFEYLPLDRLDASFVIIDSGKSRKLSESGYNSRALECEEALKQIQAVADIPDLASASPVHLAYLEDDVLYRRAKHVITETERVGRAREALINGDAEMLGLLMNASHKSLRDDFEVSCQELDLIVHYANRASYCYGARMIGAGFGGCCLALVKPGYIKRFVNYHSRKYHQSTGLQAKFHEVRTHDGVGRL